jgi:hypothetical protein
MASPPPIPPMNLAEPMYDNLSVTQQEELYFQLQMLHAFMAMVQYNDTTEKRLNWLIDLAEFTYQNHLCMLRMPKMRCAIMKLFEDFFKELSDGNPNSRIPLDLRDQTNRMYGMLLEMNRNMRNDPLYLV